MHKLLRLTALLLGFAASSVGLFAQSAPKYETTKTYDFKTTSVKVSANVPELDALANTAFNAHGAFKRVTSGQAFDIKFTSNGGNTVRVDVTKSGGASVLSETVTGTTPRNALLRAADSAVKATVGTTGFFASKLAFLSERTGKPEVYTGDLFFGEVRQITRDNAQALSVRWAPDGKRVIYTSYYKTGFPDIYLIDLSNLQRTTFVSLKGTNGSGRFSPTGSQVAMVLSGEGNAELYVSNAQGRAIRRLTRTPQAIESSPCFSPDGSQIVYTSDSAGGPQLYVIPVAGGTPRRLATNLSGYCSEPDWSKADPTKIAFSMRVGGGFQIGVHDLSGRNKTVQVSKAPVDALSPSWLADGRHLIYTARAANSRSIYILDTESGKATRVSATNLGMVSQASVFGP